jgi:hypothetical protein
MLVTEELGKGSKMYGYLKNQVNYQHVLISRGNIRVLS